MKLFSNVDTKLAVENYVARTTPESLPFIQKVIKNFLLAMFSSDSVEEKVDKLSDITDATSESIFLLRELFPTVSSYYNRDLQQIIVYSLIRKDFTLYKLVTDYIFGDDVQLRYGEALIEGGQILATDTITERGCMTDISGTYTDMELEGRAFLLFILPYSFDGQYRTLEEITALIQKYLNFITIIKAARHEVLFITEPHLIWDASGCEGIIGTSNPLSDPSSKAILDTMTISDISESVSVFVNSSDFTTEFTVFEDTRTLRLNVVSRTIVNTFRMEFSNPSIISFEGDFDSDKLAKYGQYKGYQSIFIDFKF